MGPIEIILIIIGIIIIFISCKLVDRSPINYNHLSSQKISPEQLLTGEQLKSYKDKIDAIMSEISEETIVRTDDHLSKISNEKIMAVNEFSEQILEKMTRNHEEVVFLYNMLSDKEKELKAAVREIDTSKKKVQDIVESKKNIEKEKSEKKSVNTQLPQKPKQPKPDIRPLDETLNKTTLNSLNANNNDKILALYSQGKSVVEISKLLDLGQGEVKLVIDLFRGKK